MGAYRNGSPIESSILHKPDFPVSEQNINVYGKLEAGGESSGLVQKTGWLLIAATATMAASDRSGSRLAGFPISLFKLDAELRKAK